LRVTHQVAWGTLSADIRPGNMLRIGNYLLPQQVDVDFPGADQPALTMRLEVVKGVPQCREVRFASHEGGREVRSRDLEVVHVAEWTEEFFAVFAQRIVSENGGHIQTVSSTGEAALIPAVKELQRARRGNGARKLTPEFLASVVEIYRTHMDDGPTLAVERAFLVSHRMAARYVQRARETGLLGATVPGKKGG